MLIFFLTLLVGLFMGATIILSLAYILDSRNEKEVQRRAKAVAAYMNEYDVNPQVAYNTIKKFNFDL